MKRQPYQVLVFPYRLGSNGIPEYAVFKRIVDTGGFWQGISGGGEIGETALDTAKREAYEEAGIPHEYPYIELDSKITIPVVNARGFLWGKDILVIPEYSFGVCFQGGEIKISDEHSEYKWLGYHEAVEILKWDSNKNALWELDHRIRNGYV